MFLKGSEKMSRVLSMDQSTRVSGYCLFEDDKYVCSGVVDMSKIELETPERSFEMAKALWKIIKKYQPDYLILEETSQQSNAQVLIVLSRLQGMIIGYAEAHGVNVHIILPTQWRKMLGFSQGSKVKRAELKKQSADYVKEKYGFDLSEDENEAIAINDAARKKYNLC
jgi:Holliday junction resolvasome RuvABC endonuclease subunit